MKGNIDTEDTKFIDQWVKSQTAKLNKQRLLSMQRVLSPAQEKILTARFKDTGYMDKRLYEHRQLLRDIEGMSQKDILYPDDNPKKIDGITYSTIRSDRGSRISRKTAEMQDYKDLNKNRIGFEEEYFNATKKYSDELGQYRIDTIEKVFELQKEMGVDEQRANEMRIRQIEEINNRLNDNEMAGGLKQSVQDYIDEAADKFEMFRDVGATAFSSIEDSIVEMSQTGRLEFSTMVDSMVADLTRLYVKASITGLLEKIDFSSLFSSSAGPTHVGATGNTAYGMADGGYLAETVRGVGMKTGQSYELHANEFVLPPHKLGVQESGTQIPVTVKVINEGDQSTEASASDPKFDGESWVIDVIMRNARTNKNGFGSFLQNVGGM
jgi:hypothetical protein